MTKKVYLTPKAENVELIVGPIMNIIEGSKTEVGTGDGTTGGEGDYIEPAGKNRGDWGNLWN